MFCTHKIKAPNVIYSFITHIQRLIQLSLSSSLISPPYTESSSETHGRFPSSPDSSFLLSATTEAPHARTVARPPRRSSIGCAVALWSATECRPGQSASWLPDRLPVHAVAPWSATGPRRGSMIGYRTLAWARPWCWSWCTRSTAGVVPFAHVLLIVASWNCTVVNLSIAMRDCRSVHNFLLLYFLCSATGQWRPMHHGANVATNGMLLICKVSICPLGVRSNAYETYETILH